MSLQLIPLLNAVGIGGPKIVKGNQIRYAGASAPTEVESFLFLMKPGSRASAGIPIPPGRPLDPHPATPDLEKLFESNVEEAVLDVSKKGFIPVIEFPVLQLPGTPWDEIRFKVGLATYETILSIFNFSAGSRALLNEQSAMARKMYLKLERAGFEPRAFLSQVAPHLLTSIGLSSYSN